MLRYLKEFQDHKNVIVRTTKQEYRLVKLLPNKMEDGKDEIHIKITGSKMSPDTEIYGVIGLYNFKIRKNRLRNKFDSLLGKSKILSIYVLFTSQDDKLTIMLRPLPKVITRVQDLLDEIKSQYGGEVTLNGKYINPKLETKISNESDLSYEELSNAIRVTGY